MSDSTPASPARLLHEAIKRHQAGRLDEAEALYGQIPAQAPQHADALNLLGVIAQQRGHFEDAIALAQRALVIRLAADYLVNLAEALRAVGRAGEAIAALRRAIAMQPRFPEALSNLGGMLMRSGDPAGAYTALRQAVEQAPDFVAAHSNLAYMVHFHPDFGPREILDVNVEWAQRHAAPLRNRILQHTNDPSPGRRLRIGYVSPHFVDHCIAFFTLPLLAHHDHQQVEVFCYSTSPIADDVTPLFRRHADAWRDVAHTPDAELAAMIRQDRIDILVDTTLHMAEGRLLLFAQKPAPLQVTWIGYPGTTGMDTIDYRLTDPYLDPPGTDAFYTERSIRLETFWCYSPSDPGPDVGPLPAGRNGFVTFGCLNNFAKVHPGVLALFREALEAVPGSKLILLSPGAGCEAGVLQAFGPVADRVELVPRQARRAYLDTFNRIDIALDPFPYTGHTTTLDGLWMGVPVVSMTGPTVASRGSLSQMSNLGMAEWVVRTREACVALARKAAADLARLRQVRGGLRQRMKESVLTDGPRFARTVEAAYRSMWRTWCSSRP